MDPFKIPAHTDPSHQGARQHAEEIRGEASRLVNERWKKRWSLLVTRLVTCHCLVTRHDQGDLSMKGEEEMMRKVNISSSLLFLQKPRKHSLPVFRDLLLQGYIDKVKSGGFHLSPGCQVKHVNRHFKENCHIAQIWHKINCYVPSIVRLQY